MVGVWKALLDGHQFDLEDLPGQFDADPEVTETDGMYWLTSTTFDGLPDAASVSTAAKVLVARINGAMRARDPGYQPVRLRDRYRSETGEHVVLGIASVTARGKVNVWGIAIGGTSAPRPIGPRDYAALAATDVAAADVLAILGRGELDWYDLYKVFEIIRTEVGDQKALVSVCTGWGIAEHISPFRDSANHPGVSGEAARHARQSGRVPTDTMALQQGRAFIQDLARLWLGHSVQRRRA